MPEGLIVVLEQLMTYVGATAEYLVANQRAVNLVFVLLIVCLSIVAFTAYVRARQSLDRQSRAIDRAADRRPTNGTRAGDPKFGDADAADRSPLSVPVLATAPAPAPTPLTDAGHRLSRLEEGFLQLNRDLTRFEDTAADLKEQIDVLAVRLREQPAPAESFGDVVPSIGHLASAKAVTVVDLPRQGELTLASDLPAGVIQQVSEISRRVDDLAATIDSQRRTVLAIGQVVAQMPDWRKLRGSLVESLEQIATATEGGSRRAG